MPHFVIEMTDRKGAWHPIHVVSAPDAKHVQAYVSRTFKRWVTAGHAFKVNEIKDQHAFADTLELLMEGQASAFYYENLSKRIKEDPT